MSFTILRTNVGLTTNLKIVVDSNYNLYLDSIESVSELSNSKYKNVKFIKSNYFDELFSYFYNGLPSDIAFSIKYDNDSDSASNKYSNQYDDIYQFGARNIESNKYYSEEFEYFAPLYITKGDLPSKFIIFRVDGPGIDSISKENVISEVINKFKVVKVFDLTKESSIGGWLDLNFVSNEFFPISPFEMSFDNLEFSKWNGIDYETGGYISKSSFLENIYEEEKEIFEFEKFIFDGYRKNKVVFPNILNLSFLFDDSPSDKNELRTWSINRYYGFYIDNMVLYKTISPYIPPFLKSDVVIGDNNILQSISTDPFINGYIDDIDYYVEYNGNYYKIEEFLEKSDSKIQPVLGDNNIILDELSTNIIRKWKIISDISLTGMESFLNKNTGYIGKSESEHPNRLFNYDGTNFEIEDFDSADVWVIEIDGLYHNLVKKSGYELVDNVNTYTTRIEINSDYFFEINLSSYKYWTNSQDESFTRIVPVTKPIKFNIYKLMFTDIKDFDDRIVDTEYSKYEYELKNDITNTDETKIYMQNLLSNSIPKNYDDFKIKNTVLNIPVSSEYTANYETFKISNNSLSEIWRKNSVYCRWGYQNSISSNDMPYLLNNSLIFEDFNRVANPFDGKPSRIERNLDYFYSINSSTYSYINHSLHIESSSKYGIDTSFKFELDKYINSDYDYFKYFFDRNANFDSYNIKMNVKKYSVFNSGNSSIPNSTLFKGIKFIIHEVSSIKLENNNIETRSLKSSNKFDNYKLSVLLSSNDFSIVDSTTQSNIGFLTQSQNLMSWLLIDNWKMDKSYSINDIVIKDDILYQSNSNDNKTTNPVKEYSYLKKSISAPYNQPNWSYYTNSLFWNPNSTYPGSGIGSGDVVYNNGEYYKWIGGTDNFWNPQISDSSGYLINDIVLFKGYYYASMINGNNYRPDFSSSFINGSDYSKYWSLTQSNSKCWDIINIWEPNVTYSNSYIVHNGALYSCLSSQAGNEPGISNEWKLEYKINSDTSIVYQTNNNPIVLINDYFYLIESNTSNSTLENGINIYINEKWKNIIINISISDNTVKNISNVDRDLLYNELNSKLSANNFINSINDISNKNGFIDYLNYVIIGDDIKKYNALSISNLPYIISCETPSEIFMKTNSLYKKPIEIPKSLKPSKVLDTIKDDLSNINYYNNIPIAVEIDSNNQIPSTGLNPRGTDVLSDVIYRFSGYYMPIFYDIQLFNKGLTSSIGNFKFDTDLSEFGIVKERKIRKINHKSSILKLDNIKNYKSIYPMIDEFGYTTVDFFIFKSTWDKGYHNISSIVNEEIPSNIYDAKLVNIENFGTKIS